MKKNYYLKYNKEKLVEKHQSLIYMRELLRVRMTT